MKIIRKGKGSCNNIRKDGRKDKGWMMMIMKKRKGRRMIILGREKAYGLIRKG